MKDDSDKAREALQRAAKHAKAFDIRSEALLHDVLYILHNAHQAPFSSYAKVDRDEVIGLIEEVIDALPEELAEARKMVEDKEAFLVKRDREAQEILDDVRAQAERMVQRSEIVREARRSAQHIVDEANAEAARVRYAADEYCDKRLAAFELSLDRVLRSVREGREKMASSTTGADSAKSSAARTGGRSGERGSIRSASDAGASGMVDATGASAAGSQAGSLPGSTSKKNAPLSVGDAEAAAGHGDIHLKRHGVQPVGKQLATEESLRNKPVKEGATREGAADTHFASQGDQGSRDNRGSQGGRDPDSMVKPVKNPDSGSTDNDEEDDSNRHFFDQDKA